MTPQADEPRSLWQNIKRFVLWLLRRNPEALRQNLEDALDEESENITALAQSFTPKERHMLRNLLGFRDVLVRDVMVPRANITASDADTALPDLYAQFLACAHSRLPIYQGELDNPLGMVHIKDAFKAMQDKQGNHSIAKDIQREMLFVPPSMPALDLLLKMQATHIHLALVIDEYGGTSGLVSIENLVEEIVGEIVDEHEDTSPPQLVEAKDGVLEAPAGLSVRALEEQISIGLRNGKRAESDSLGGLVVALAGQVPQRGEVVPHPSGVEFEIKDADARRIKSLRIRLPAPQAQKQ